MILNFSLWVELTVVWPLIMLKPSSASAWDNFWAPFALCIKKYVVLYPQAFRQKISMKPDFRYFASELFIKFNFAYVKSNCHIPFYDRFYVTNSKNSLIFNVMNLTRFNCATENIFVFVPSLGNCAAMTSRPKFSGLQIIAHRIYITYCRYYMANHCMVYKKKQ